MIQHTRLSNGVRILTRHLSARRGVALGVWLRSGSRYEAETQAGYAHLIEHLLFKGNGKDDAAALARSFEAMGGQINAHTSRELMALHGTVPANHVAGLLSSFIGMLREPRFDEHDLAMERQVVLQEMAMVRDSPEESLEDTAVEYAWPGHAVGRPVLGRRPVIERASIQSLHTYLQSRCTGEHVWVAAAGDVDHAALVEACAPLAMLPPGALAQEMPPHFTAGEHARRSYDEQAHLMWLLPCMGMRDPDYYNLLAANHLLGGGTSSRLFQEVRERRGLAYGIHSRLDLYSDCGLWIIQTACDPETADVCREAVETTVAGIIQQGVEEDELDIARRYLLANLALDEDDPETVMERIAREAIYLGRHPVWEEWVTALQGVTPALIRQALAQRWRERLFVQSRP